MTKKTDETLAARVREARLDARRMVKGLEAAKNPLEARRVIERLEGHSTCEENHSHYRAGCCPVCTTKWGDIPKGAPSVPIDAITEHDKANWDQETWAIYDQENVDWAAYLANWTPENCQHEFCYITADNHEICQRCDKDVTEFDAPVAEFEEARRRWVDWEARENKIASEQQPPTYDLDL
jgi:hypothetical protein